MKTVAATKIMASSPHLFLLGRVNAVSAALSGLMPMMSCAAYSPIYYYTIDTFPAAQFYVGASLNTLIMVPFM